VFSPAYLFNANGSRAARPVMTKVSAEIQYREQFDLSVAGDARQIGSVVLLRSDHNTHSLTAGDRYVKLGFRVKDGDASQPHELRVTAPKLQGQAVPGIYMLFIVDKNGTPSEGRRIDIRPDTRGNTPQFK
jgi:hypothetical protein